MPTIPIRTLGKIGVITDLNAFDLPPEAVTDARNVRFSNGRISNAQVWREAIASPTGGTPVFLFKGERTNNFDILGYSNSTGSAYHVSNAVITDVSPTGYVPAASAAQRTFNSLQGVYYLNQEDRVPWYFNSASTKYAALPNWTSTHRCKSLRSFKDYLIALNITKAGVTTPNMVKWSNIALYDSVPDSWDPADTTKSAGENTLGEVQSDILDGLQLRNSFVVYAKDQAWLMEYTQGPDVFQFFKLYGDNGILNTNCVVEINGMHFVFDDDDIYMHDGVSPPKSIVDKRIRRTLFKHLDITKTSVCFIHHDMAAAELWFCHNSLKDGLKWPAANCAYCNYAAVYNYIEDTWTFHDLPNVSGMTSIGWQTAVTYDVATALTYDGMGTSYSGLVSNGYRTNFATSIATTGITNTRLLDASTGVSTSLPFTAVTELAVVPFVERTGLDLDEMLPELRAYKNYRSIYPQVVVEDASAPLSFKFGGVDNPQQLLEWDTLQSFEATTDYKIDTRSRGRYLAWYFQGANVNTYSLSGFDLDIVSVSRR